MQTIIIQLATAFFGSLGFSIMFRVRGRLLLPASLGGLFTWSIYLLLHHLTGTIFSPCLLASAFAAAYAELLARLLHAPATLFVIPSAIPLIPGSYLYYGMLAAVQNRMADCQTQFFLMMEFAIAIALGMSVVWTIIYMSSHISHSHRTAG
ncbi:MAG: threonine/serine exporter family protein [Lactimicrobium sp.]|jgi:uncharacterized membrane protein YjjB (DUF3815 family)|uniref:threonine/serine exporter family protein n=1 Tax=Lactimicrobium sp. TaxID=2563780 RepID=UPI002F351113